MGVPEAFFGEELLAVVRPKEGADVTEQDLREFYKRKVSHQKIPRYFQFVDAYPLTASSKVQKFVLREQAIQALGLQEIANSKQDTERLLNEMTAVYEDCLRSPEHAAVRADLKAHEKTT